MSKINIYVNSKNRKFFINLIIVDEDPELTQDLTLAPPIDYNNYFIDIPI